MSACCVLHKFSRLSASLFLYLTGALALRTLLTGAKSIYSPSRRRRCFEKEGTLFTALKDFEEVNPKNVKEYTNPRGVSIFDYLMSFDHNSRNSHTLMEFNNTCLVLLPKHCQRSDNVDKHT